MNLKKALKNSEVLRFVDQLKNGKWPSYRTRELRVDEIQLLETNGNQAENWGWVQVAQNFDPARVKNNTFIGKNILPHFYGTVLNFEGFSVQTGLYSSTVQGCSLENAHIYNVGTLSNMVVGEGALIRNVGSICVIGKTTFGIGSPIDLGAESGERQILAWPEMDSETLEWLSLDRRDSVPYFQNREWVKEYAQSIELTHGFVDKGASICNTQSIRNSWIGMGAQIDGVTKISHSVLMSRVEQPLRVNNGVVIQSCMIQKGSKISNQVHLSHSAVFEDAKIQNGAHVEHSVIGSGSSIAFGVVKNSLLGPFLNCQAKSSLFSVLWPQGFGSVQEGSCVGGNPLGSLFVNELRFARGMRVGIHSHIVGPSDFSGASWTRIDAKISLKSCLFQFPFSLIQRVSYKNDFKALELEVLPGYLLGNEAYSLTELEFFAHKNDRRKRRIDEMSIMSFESAREVLLALQKLIGVIEIKEFYSENEILGLGEGILKESNRQKAIVYYKNYLERFALRFAVLSMSKNPSWLSALKPIGRRIYTGEFWREVLKIIQIPAQTALILKHYRHAEKHWYELILKEVEAHRVCNRDLFFDHDSLQVSANPLLEYAMQNLDESKIICRNILQTLKEKEINIL